jgi:hypothetical protein
MEETMDMAINDYKFEINKLSNNVNKIKNNYMINNKNNIVYNNPVLEIVYLSDKIDKINLKTVEIIYGPTPTTTPKNKSKNCTDTNSNTSSDDCIDDSGDEDDIIIISDKKIKIN